MIQALAALAALTALRLAVAGLTPLSPDEAYYWVWSRALATGYYDHPPMVALWIRAGTALLGDTALGVRLLAPLSAALGSLLLVAAGRDLGGDRRVGLHAAILLNATLGFGVGAVSMTPDTPLIFFWIAAIAAVARLLASGQGAWFLAIGLAAGLALASKYTAIFLGAGIALWLLAVPVQRAWLLGPWPWLGGLLGLAVFAPVLAWNAARGWAGFARQGSRVGGFRPDQASGYLLELLGGQVGLLTPVIFVLACAGTGLVARKAWWTRDPAAALLAILTLLPWPVFLEHTLTDRVQGNWPAIVYPTALLAAALLAAPAWQRLRAPAIALGLAITAAVYVQASLAILPIPTRLDPSMKRLAGWADFARDVATIARARDAAFISAADYAVASELAWRQGALPVAVAQPRWRLFDLPREDRAGLSGLLVRSARLGEAFDTSAWAEVTEIGLARRARNGVTAEEYRLYRVVSRADTLTLLPRPAARSER